MTSPRPGSSTAADPRLRVYAGTSWNAQEAVLRTYQLAALVPVYRRNLEAMYGRTGIGDARRMWGLVADLVSAMIDVPPTLEGLVRAGFEDARSMGYVFANTGPFALVESPALQRLDFTQAATGNMLPLLADADAHDRVARPLLKALQAELRLYEDEIHDLVREGQVEALIDLIRALPAEPVDFPLWDGRPMFLEEQRTFLEYLNKAAAAEIVADHLVDDKLGEFMLRVAGVMQWSEVLGESILDINVVPRELLSKPASYVSHGVGNAILDVLRVFDTHADPLDRLYVVEMAVKTELGIDISPALDRNRAKLVDEHVAAYEAFVVDLTADSDTVTTPLLDLTGVRVFEFPELGTD